MERVMVLRLVIQILQMEVRKDLLLIKQTNESKFLYILILYIMTEVRKNQILQDFRRPPTNKSSRSRELKERLHLMRSKENFLTDTQASDYTRSSGEINSPQMQHLKELVRKLQRENAELRQQVTDLKATQCFEVKEQRLKSMIMQNDRLRGDFQNTKKQLQKSLVQRDFLQRFNKNLKIQCESLTKEILVLKANSKGESKKIDKNIYTSREEKQYEKSRNSSKDSVMSKKKEFLRVRKEKEEKQRESLGTLKGCSNTSQLQQDYYGGKTCRPRPIKHH